MRFTIRLEYTPRCPQPELPFTEESFVRRSKEFTFDLGDVGLALVDLWNCGWEDGPVGETLRPELCTERGVSHARRKRRIIEETIAPTISRLRSLGMTLFHCNHARFLEGYPQWLASTTESEREALAAQCEKSGQNARRAPDDPDRWPPAEWARDWREEHRDLLFCREWSEAQSREVYPRMKIAAPVKPQPGDLLVYSRDQFHRLLTERRIRVLFYMGFETDECLQFASYGIANIQDLGYLCIVVRDGTATYETAETLDGLWKTRLAIDSIETRWGYSVTSERLRQAVAGPLRSAY
jgi:hypothetical protein